MAKLHTGAHDIINLRLVSLTHFMFHGTNVAWFYISPLFLFYRNSYHGGSPFAMEMTNLGNWKFPLHRNLGIHAVSLLNNNYIIIIIIIIIYYYYFVIRRLILMCTEAHGVGLIVVAVLLKPSAPVAVLKVLIY